MNTSIENWLTTQIGNSQKNKYQQKAQKKMANLTQNIFKNTYNLYAKKVTENGEKIL